MATQINKNRDYINVGMIAEGMNTDHFTQHQSENFNVKKIQTQDRVTANLALATYPEVEIVDDINSIFADASIELVIVSTSAVRDSQLLQFALEAGKQVRII